MKLFKSSNPYLFLNLKYNIITISSIFSLYYYSILSIYKIRVCSKNLKSSFKARWAICLFTRAWLLIQTFFFFSLVRRNVHKNNSQNNTRTVSKIQGRETRDSNCGYKTIRSISSHVLESPPLASFALLFFSEKYSRRLKNRVRFHSSPRQSARLRKILEY